MSGANAIPAGLVVIEEQKLTHLLRVLLINNMLPSKNDNVVQGV